MPELIVVGGANGAGKSTFIREFLKRRPYRYLCADEAAFELCPEAPETVGVAAGRLFLKRMAEAREEGVDVIIESTLSGKSFAGQVRKFSERTYTVKTLFVTPLDLKISVERVTLRVSKGGHSVPEEDIRRRFSRAHQNFWHHYRNLSDEWQIYYNESEEGHKLMAFGRKSRLAVRDTERFDLFLKLCYHTNP